MSDLNVQNINSKTGSSAISIADSGAITSASDLSVQNINSKTGNSAISIADSGVISGLWSDNGTVNSNAKFVKLTQAQYDAITPDSNTIYFIV